MPLRAVAAAAFPFPSRAPPTRRVHYTDPAQVLEAPHRRVATMGRRIFLVDTM